MQDIFIAELVQEIPDAAQYELEIFSRIYGLEILKVGKDLAVMKGESAPLKDAAFINRLSKIVGEYDEIEQVTGVNLPEGKFYIRFKDASDCHDSKIEVKLGEILSAKGRVSFKDPDFIVRIYHWEKWYISIEQFQQTARNFDTRRAPMRPFFSPISIHPRLARFMVSVSGTRPGDTILDPFCGTGGILLEAGITGRKVKGNDWSLQMTTGARLNLKYFGIRGYEITNQDFLKMNVDEKVDAIITDLPYGRNALISQKDLSSLYKGSFTKFRDILKDGGRCVIVVSSLEMLRGVEKHFQIEKVLKYRVHKSLTRYFAVLVKESRGS